MKGIKICIVTMLLTALYLLGSVALSNLLFFNKSNGSIIKINNKIIGSKLIGQSFKDKKYFHGRPSLNNYKNDISGNSNLGYHSMELRQKVVKSYKTYKSLNENINFDFNLITESGSGLDPHITYNGAISQVNRISKSTGLSSKEIQNIIDKNSKRRILDMYGEKIINILELNIDLNKKLVNFNN